MVPQVARHIGGREREEIVITLIASRIWTGQIYPPGEAPAGKEFHGAWRACPHKATEETCLTKHPFSHELAPFSRVSRSPCCCAAASRRTRTHRQLNAPRPQEGHSATASSTIASTCSAIIMCRKLCKSVCFTWPRPCVCVLSLGGVIILKSGGVVSGESNGRFPFFFPFLGSGCPG